MGRVLRTTAVTLTAASTLAITGCGADPGVIEMYSAGWPAAHGDARNSDTSPVTGSRSTELAWSRPLLAPTSTSASIAPNGQIAATTHSSEGCNLWSFQMETGRKRWCTRLGPGVAFSTPLVDRHTNIYVGEDGAMTSFNDLGQLRWRTIVSGTPLSAQFTGDGNVLIVTQVGVVSVLSPQTGKAVVPSYQLVPAPTVDQGQDVPLPAPGLGLDQCVTGSPACPVGSVPAIDLESGRIHLEVWRPGRSQPDLVALRYHDGTLTEEWSSDAIPGGGVSSPVLSADGSTLYVTDRRGSLWAVDATTGRPRWQHDLGYVAVGGPSVSSDGTIVPAAGDGTGHLMALRDDGDHAEILWERPDLRQRGIPVQTAGGTGYTVVSGADDGLTAVTFDTTSGDTVDQDPLPNARGVAAGTSIGPDGEVLVSTLMGELFVLKP